MKISATYRFIASLLSLSILIGVSIPSGLQAMSEDVCDEMKEMQHPMQPMSQHGEDCPMNGQPAEMPENQHHPKTDKTHHKAHNLGFACACSIDEAPVKTEAPVFQKVKTQMLVVVQVLEENHTTKTEFDAPSFLTSDSYSPPLIYLANESFLI
ncbi:hypothetical protein [Gracilimonas halophila]|uniref:Uncharacterized protein n=1 Tax=Gracilimonas halophila TaxID=1834464 RepID=A0ABW5JFR6_9BACT